MAKAITLLESTRADHRAQGDELLTALLRTRQGVPAWHQRRAGRGKSTFIEGAGPVPHRQATAWRC